jgi:hypothetical protein
MLALTLSVNEEGRKGALPITGSRVMSTIVFSSSVKVKAWMEVVIRFV